MDTVFGKIRFKRGNAIDLPVLDIGEPAFALDTTELWMGTANGNLRPSVSLAAYPRLTAFETLGDLGTPSSLIATNLTGTAIGLTAGAAILAAASVALATVRTIGGSNFNGTADVTSFPAPGAIGGTTPAAGTFTALTGTSGSITGLTALAVRDTLAAFDVTLAATSSTALTVGRTLTFDVVNAARTIKLTGNPTLADWFDQSVKTTASPTFATVTAALAGNVTGNVSGSSGSCTGNAATATALATVRTIGGSNFTGAADVTSFPAPGAIGGTTPAAGTFTALTGTSGSITGLTALAVKDTSAAFNVTLAATSSTPLTIGRTLTFDVVNAARTIKLTGNPTLADWFDQSVKTTASPTFATVTAALAGNVTGNVSGSSGSCTGNAATATVASAVALAGITGLGIGISTALGVNIGSAGAVLVDGTNTTGILPYDVLGYFGGTWKTAHKLTSTDPTGSGTGSRSTFTVKRSGVGSGTNGSDHTDYALHLEIAQDNFLATTVMGEMDGMYIVGTKGANGDLGGILLDLTKVEASLYGIVGVESVISWVNASGTVLEGCRTITNGRIGGSDLRTGCFGFMVEPSAAGLTVAHGLLILGNTGTVTTAIECSTSRDVSNTYFKVTPSLVSVPALSVFLGQIAFPGTMNPAANGNTLDDYEEGTWTPFDASGAGLVFSFTDGFYIKVGRLVTVGCILVYPSTAQGSPAAVGGLPFTSQNVEGIRGGCLSAHNGNTATKALVNKNATTFNFFTNNLTNVTNAQLSLTTSWFSATYATG